jgi:hypothetical protein
MAFTSVLVHEALKGKQCPYGNPQRVGVYAIEALFDKEVMRLGESETESKKALVREILGDRVFKAPTWTDTTGQILKTPISEIFGGN